MKKFLSTLCVMLVILLAATPLTPALNGVTGSTVIVAQAAGIKLNAKKKTLVKGQTYTLKLSGTKKKIKWTTSKKSVATVNGKGKVTAKGKGTAKITATVGSTKYTCKITVETPKINKKTLCLASSDTYGLKVTGTSQTMKWSSSDKSVATVNSSGKVTAKSAGTATVTCKLESGKKYTCTVTVESPKINKSALTLEEGNTFALKVTDTSQSKTWQSSNTNVASVNSSGVVTAKKAGTAKITCKLKSGKTLTCSLTVKAPSIDINKIKVKDYDMGNGIVCLLTNNNKKALCVKATVLYYDNSGNIIDKHYDEIYCLESGRTCVLNVLGPYDSNYEYIEYASYDIKITAENISHMYYGADDIYISDSNSPNTEKVIVSASNTGDTNYEFINLSILFFDEDNNLIGFEERYAHCENVGSTDYITFDYPYDDNYDTIIPAHYEIYVNYAYGYNW